LIKDLKNFIIKDIYLGFLGSNHIIHKNNAARKKSKMKRMLNDLK